VIFNHASSLFLLILVIAPGWNHPWISNGEISDESDAAKSAGFRYIFSEPDNLALLTPTPSMQEALPTPSPTLAEMAPTPTIALQYLVSVQVPPPIRPPKSAPSPDSGLLTLPVKVPESNPVSPSFDVGSMKLTQELEYFSELAFGSEYRGSIEGLHRWEGDIRVKVYGQPTSADLRTLREVTQELDALTSGVTLVSASDNPNLEIYFVGESQFKTIEPDYVATNFGFFRVWWDRNGAIYRARILISSDGISQVVRSHLIREELTQSLGLFNDSWKYPTSIFYQGWTAANEYSSLDRTVIGWLYLPGLSPGMTPGHAIAVLTDIGNSGLD